MRMLPSVITTAYHPELGLSYLCAGDTGPVLLFLHGWGAFKELWWMTLRDLGQDYRCFALDMPGHGDSRLGRAATIPGLAEVVIAFCEQMGLREVILFGHSMGGSVAAEIALQRPDLLRMLFLVDAAVESQRMPLFTRIYLLPHVGWPALRLSQMLGRLFSPLGMRVPHAHGGGVLRPWARRAAYLARFDPEGLYRLLRSLFTHREPARLRGITTPTVVVSGLFDLLVPVYLSYRLARHIPGARLAIIPAAVHNPMDERPDDFCRVVRRLLGG